jgi:RHS repeat-associated protein
VAAVDEAGNTSDASNAATTTAGPAASMPVSYTYDLADRLTAISTASGSTTTFTLDALGRHASQTIDKAPTQAYSYLGTSDTIVAINSSGATTVSAIDAVGNRVATGSAAGYGYLLGDLHGNTAAALNQTCSAITDAFAYDAYGNTVASVTSALPTPWRYQGRILESAANTPDLYDFGARSYSPALGAFTSLDTSHGSAQNPHLLNGYLYADANPTTLVDPDGHCASGEANTWNFDTRSVACTPTAATLVQNQVAAKMARVKYLNGQLNADFKKSAAAAKAAAAAKPRDCGPFGVCIDLGGAARYAAGKVSDLAGGVGNLADSGNRIWRQTGGAVVDYGINHPTQVLAVAAIVAACATGVLCGAVVAGALVGVASYGAEHTVEQARHGKNPWDDINPDDVANNALIGEAAGAITGGSGAFFGRAMTTAGFTAGETAAARLMLRPLSGGLGAASSLLISHATDQPSPLDDLCTVLSSFVGGNAATVGCGVVQGAQR